MLRQIFSISLVLTCAMPAPAIAQTIEPPPETPAPKTTVSGGSFLKLSQAVPSKPVECPPGSETVKDDDGTVVGCISATEVHAASFDPDPTSPPTSPGGLGSRRVFRFAATPGCIKVGTPPKQLVFCGE